MRRRDGQEALEVATRLGAPPDAQKVDQLDEQLRATAARALDDLRQLLESRQEPIVANAQ
jgi:hypothetical protein